MSSNQKKYESPLHEELGMTDAEIRREMIVEGLDPDVEAAKLRAMIASTIASHRARSQGSSRHEGERKSLVLYDESVAAGHPSPCCGAPKSQVTLMDLIRVAHPETSFWARVSGCSMRDAGILDGDSVLIDSIMEARDGDIVLAHLAGQGQVIKYLRLPIAGGVILESAHPDYAPIEIKEASGFQIHGVVKGRAGPV